MQKPPRIRNTSPELLQVARQLRRDKTPAERHLWSRLQNKQLNGLRFRFQHPVEAFVLDFYCPASRLVVEVDGGIHDDPDVAAHDAERNAYLTVRGCVVLRFRNAEVLYETERVLAEIAATAASRLQSPDVQREENTSEPPKLGGQGG